MQGVSLRRRKEENEEVFRKFNGQVQKRFDEANKIAAEEGAEPIELDADKPLYFYCECADENCQQRVLITPNDYDKIHEKRGNYVVTNGHEIAKIERVIRREQEYCVVEKYNTPPRSARKLKPTDADNA
jgi:hypothetical protein